MKQSNNETISTVFTIDRFEEGKAVLIGEHFEVIIPKKLVPKSCLEGDILHLTLSSDKAETEQRRKKAKEILNEILNSK
jgi:hypothetical protein